MESSVRDGVLRWFDRVALAAEGGTPDAELLGRFAAHRDEAAFAALVRRHGRMVWGVCRRLLNDADAEDAFQATFLVLVTKAAAITGRETVGSWLYGVAYRTARQARVSAARRRAKEGRVRPRAGAAADEEVARHELGATLDEEVSRLPEAFRQAVVLCDLLGHTKRQAARELGVPEGTVASRLARGRRLLRGRLTCRGLTLSAGALGALVIPNAAPAGVPAPLVCSTIAVARLLAAGQAVAGGAIPGPVAALTKGTLNTMRLTKLKLVVWLAAALALGVGGLGLSGYHAGARPPVAEAGQVPADGAQPGPAPAAGAPDGEKPGAHYARLVFGRQAAVHALVRLDGEAIAIDRDGDGRFISRGEQFVAEEDVKDVTIADPDGQTSYVITHLHVMHVVPPEKFLTVRVHIRGPLAYHQEGFFQLAEDRKAAPDVRFHGPLTVGPKTWTIGRGLFDKRLVSESTLPRSLPRAGETNLDVVVYTETRGGVVGVCSPDPPSREERRPPLPAGVQPFADVEFPSQTPGGPAVKKRYPLGKTTDGMFRGAVRVPAEAGAGPARVTFSLDAWPGAKVAPTTVEVAVDGQQDEKRGGAGDGRGRSGTGLFDSPAAAALIGSVNSFLRRLWISLGEGPDGREPPVPSQQPELGARDR